MVRREIRNFELVIGESRYECSVPCSVRSVLAAANVDVQNIGGTVRFESVIYVDDVALAIKNFYLRIRGISSPAKIYIGDKLIGEADGVTPVYNLNVAGLFVKGNNTLSVRFSAADCEEFDLVGLSFPVEMLRFSGAIIDRLTLSQKHEEGRVSLGVKLDLIGNSDSVRAVATLISSSGQMYFSGLTKGEGSVEINDPLYWWPKGQGVQNLYRLTVNLYGESEIEDSVEVRIALRTAVCGENGAIVVNGMNMIPMGAMYIPEGDSDINVADRKTEAFVGSAAMANYSCLLIPLDAPIPSDKFYDLCDKNGIMVIEEHDALDDANIESIRRRANHPSLCLIDLIGEGDRTEELKKLSDVLPDLSVRVIDKQPEYLGLPSLPSMKTIRAVVPENERNLFSHSIEAIAEGNALKDMLMSVADRYPYPPNLAGFAYASALASAHKVGDAIKESRLTLGKSGRAIFNRINDPRMAISTSAIDSRGRWKPLQYYSARHFAPIAVYADFKDGTVAFSASSQRRIDCIGTLEYRIADASNYTIFKDSVECEISSMTSSVIHTANISEYVKGHEREYYLEYYVKEGSSALSRKILLFVPEKHFVFKRPKMKAVVSGQDRNFSLTISADTFVKDIEIGFDGIDAVFEDNYFDITSDAPIKINFTVTGGMENTYRLKDNLQMRSVVDLIR